MKKLMPMVMAFALAFVAIKFMETPSFQRMFDGTQRYAGSALSSHGGYRPASMTQSKSPHSYSGTPQTPDPYAPIYSLNGVVMTPYYPPSTGSQSYQTTIYGPAYNSAASALSYGGMTPAHGALGGGMGYMPYQPYMGGMRYPQGGW